MTWFLDFLRLLLIGATGWLFFSLFRIPGSAMLGSMFFSFLLATFGPFKLMVPIGLDFIFQVIVGFSIGTTFRKLTPKEFMNDFKIIIITINWWLILSVFLAVVVSISFDGIDITTAFLGTLPGGVAEMSLMAVALGADLGFVAIMQIFRSIFVPLFTPIVAVWINNKHAIKNIPKGSGERLFDESKRMENFEKQCENTHYFFSFLYQIGIAIVGACFFSWLGFPAAFFVGAMTSTGLMAILGLPMNSPPEPILKFGQLGLGALIGMQATNSTIYLFQRIFIPVITITVIMIVWGICLAFIIYKFSDWNLITALIATSPGGLSQLSSIAEELGADPLKVSLLHLVRLLTIIFLVPYLIDFFL